MNWFQHYTMSGQDARNAVSYGNNSRPAHDFEVCDDCDELKRDCTCKPCDTEGCKHKAHVCSENQFCAKCELESWQYELKRTPINDNPEQLRIGIQVKLWSAHVESEERNG